MNCFRTAPKPGAILLFRFLVVAQREAAGFDEPDDPTRLFGGFSRNHQPYPSDSDRVQSVDLIHSGIDRERIDPLGLQVDAGISLDRQALSISELLVAMLVEMRLQTLILQQTYNMPEDSLEQLRADVREEFSTREGLQDY